jgi:hypothetical protein
LPLFFNFALEYAIRKVQENQEGLKRNGLYRFWLMLMIWNLLEDIDTNKKNKETLGDNTDTIEI